MTDKKNNFVKDINVSHKRKIKCKYKIHDDYHFNGKPYCTCFNELCEDISIICDHNCQIYEDYKQLARKTQECEKLKSQIDADYEDYSQELKTLRNIIENKEKRNASLFVISNNYRKALEEIEAVCLEDTRTFADGTTVRYDALDEILEIINKAKGE